MAEEDFKDNADRSGGFFAKKTAADAPLPLVCMECDKKFKRRVGPGSSPKCPGCGGYDVEPDYDGGTSYGAIHTAALEHLGWTKDGSDITPLADEIMEAADSVEWGNYSGAEGDTKRAADMEALKSVLAPFVNRVTPADMEVLEDYNYHTPYAVLEGLGAKTADISTDPSKVNKIGPVYISEFGPDDFDVYCEDCDWMRDNLTQSDAYDAAGTHLQLTHNLSLRDEDFDKTSRKTADYQYVKPAGGGKYKIVQKGTGKTLSTHDSKEQAESAFRAMESHMHGSKTAFNISDYDNGYDQGYLDAKNGNPPQMEDVGWSQDFRDGYDDGYDDTDTIGVTSTRKTAADSQGACQTCGGPVEWDEDAIARGKDDVWHRSCYFKDAAPRQRVPSKTAEFDDFDDEFDEDDFGPVDVDTSSLAYCEFCDAYTSHDLAGNCLECPSVMVASKTAAEDEWKLRICSDCLICLANGMDSMDLEPEREAEIEKGFAREEAGGYYIVPGDEEYGFSHSSCDICRSPLGGDRYEAIMFKQGRKVAWDEKGSPGTATDEEKEEQNQWVHDLPDDVYNYSEADEVADQFNQPGWANEAPETFTGSRRPKG